MIEKLSKNPQVASVEPNGVSELQSLYNYSVSDPMSGFCYQANSPQAQNMTGANVRTRGAAPEKTVSTNAGFLSDRVKDNEDEVVVAVIDSGVKADHEDLKDMLWTNPGNIGLLGEHGFNTAENDTDIDDWLGHGTHVAGIIGAQANNAKGIAGVASGTGLNVKLMILSTCEHKGTQEFNNYFRELGAFNYVLKAKQRGVNIVAVNCSWGGRRDDSKIFDEILNRLGEEGVFSFIAAGNDSADMDNNSYAPLNGDSPYTVVVGAMDIDGKPAGFTNYGKSQVDVFAPGMNILSTIGYAGYFPSIYSKEKRSATTEYFGMVDANTQVVDNKVVLSTGDSEGVKAFGASVVHKQKLYENSESSIDESFSYELEVAEDKHLLSDNPYMLKLTMSGTSQATPAALGAYAVYAALHPRQEEQSLSDYVLNTRAGFLSCSRRTEELNDLCATGGYIDLMKIDENDPVITDAVCDLDAKTVTLSGVGLNAGNILKYQLLEDETCEEIAVDPASVGFAADGASIVITNAEYLFNLYTRFTLYHDSELCESNAFFLVKGQKRPEKLCEQRYPEILTDSKFRQHRTIQSARLACILFRQLAQKISARRQPYLDLFVQPDEKSGCAIRTPELCGIAFITPDYRLLTDEDGENLYEVDLKSGRLAVYKDGQFAEYRSTDLKEYVLQHLKKLDIGYTDYELYRCCEVRLKELNSPLTTGNTLYMFADVTYSPYTEASPQWSFSEITYPDGFFNSTWNYAVFEGKLYCIGFSFGSTSQSAAVPQAVYSYDPASQSWQREADFPINESSVRITCKDGRMYAACGVLCLHAGAAADQMICRDVYCLENGEWKRIAEIPYVGRNEHYGGMVMPRIEGVCTPVKNGLIFLNCSADGLGNVFLCGCDGVNQPVYYTFNDYLNVFILIPN